MTLGERIEKFVIYIIPDRKHWKEKLGMGNNGLSAYFKNQRKPGYELIERLVNLGLNPTWLFKEEGEMIYVPKELGIENVYFVSDTSDAKSYTPTHQVADLSDVYETRLEALLVKAVKAEQSCKELEDEIRAIKDEMKDVPVSRINFHLEEKYEKKYKLAKLEK